MSRSIFTSTFQYLSDFVRPAQTAATGLLEPHGLTREKEPDRQLARSSALSNFAERKRKAEKEAPDEPWTKRARNEDRLAFLLQNDDDSSNHTGAGGDDLFAGPNATNLQEDMDRALMPPPPTPHRIATYRLRHRAEPTSKPGLEPWREDDAISFSSSALTRRKVEDMDAHAMEEARRHAAAIRLPPNSGIWSQTERELFFHLAYRGFEALLPENWMLDFDTLPISVFANGNTLDVPVIHNVRDNQFRACHALRRLFEAGHDVRDRTHVSPGYKREKILGRSVKRYLYWAFTDVGLRPSSNSTYLPVHVVVTKRGDRSTLQTLEDTAMKLHSLSQRHQRARGVHSSIEGHELTASDAEETRVIEDDESSPTLIGLVIISSVLAIVTLSPFSVLPPQQPIRQTLSPPHSDPDPAPSTLGSDFNPDRLRIIAELDFSQKDQDVWNALGVAIVAMQIRKEALKANFGLSYDDIDATGAEAMSVDGSELDETFGSFSRLEVEDPDL